MKATTIQVVYGRIRYLARTVQTTKGFSQITRRSLRDRRVALTCGICKGDTFALGAECQKRKGAKNYLCMKFLRKYLRPPNPHPERRKNGENLLDPSVALVAGGRQELLPAVLAVQLPLFLHESHILQGATAIPHAAREVGRAPRLVHRDHERAPVASGKGVRDSSKEPKIHLATHSRRHKIKNKKKNS